MKIIKAVIYCFYYFLLNYNIFNSMIKFLGIDLDGTLLKSNKKIAASSYLVLDAFCKKYPDCINVVITGRAFNSAQNYCLQTNKNTGQAKISYLACYNGALILKINEKNEFSIINKILIPDNLAELIFNLSLKFKIFFWGYPENLHHGASVLVSKHPLGKLIQIVRWKDMYSFKKYIHDNYFKINLMSHSKSRLDKIQNEIKSNYDHLFEVARVSDKLAEITAKSVNKGLAVNKICELNNIDYKNRCGIGDSKNDLPMFEVVNYKVATKGADSDLKKIATYIGTKGNTKQFSCVFDDYLLKIKN